MKTLIILFVLVAVPASAQTVVTNPTKVEFTASADHAGTLSDGTPIVAAYQFDAVGMNSQGAIAISKSLGKPAPDTVTGCGAPAPCISVVVPELSTLTKNVTYTATVTAVGPGGSTPSVASNPFARPGPPSPVGTPVVK